MGGVESLEALIELVMSSFEAFLYDYAGDSTFLGTVRLKYVFGIKI